MLQAVFLDTGPLGMVCQQPGKSAESDACRLWMENLLMRNISVYVPEVADYEVRRELIRAGKASSIMRLNNLKLLADYLPITTEAMLLASDMWAKARNMGIPTADSRALDADVVLVAQALSAGLPASDIIVASVNVRHIARFVASDVWANINP